MFTKSTRIEPYQVLTLNELKDQVNLIDHDEDDIYLVSVGEAVLDAAERVTKRFMSPHTVICEFDSCVRSLYLPFDPVTSVQTVQIDTTDVEYTFSEISGILKITDTSISANSIIRVTYTAGYDKVPPLLRHAMKIMVSDFYTYRESIVEGKTEMPVPVSAMDILNGFKLDTV